jgi:putative transposase
MARRHRDVAPGIHHVAVGATGTDVYFGDDVDRMAWVRRLVRTIDRYEWTCLLFCQMTTHVHLLVDVPDESLPHGMHFLNFDYSKEFNVRHGRRGYLIRSRYWSKRILSVGQLLVTFRYVARNPLRAGLCELAELWRWSSLATSCGRADAFPFVDAAKVIELFGRPPAALQALLDFIAAGE